MVYALILVNLGVFVLDKMLGSATNYMIQRKFYMYSSAYSWKWWQPLTCCFCHANKTHLSNNLFLLLLFGRSVEDDLGATGLLVSFVLTGVVSSLVSLLLLPKYTVSSGASGAVFGLFAVSTWNKLSSSWKDLVLDWRKLVELAVLGEFVVTQLVSEVATAASGGGHAGINHVAHLSGAAAGTLMVWGMQKIVTRFEKAEQRQQPKQHGK